MKITAKELKKGKTSVWETKNKENRRIAEICFNSKSGLYLIWFDRTFIWGCKTFKSLANRFEKLKEKFDLEFYNIQ